VINPILQGGRMEGPRVPKQTEYSDIISFLNKKLRPDTEWSILQEYPMALAQANQRNARVIYDQNNEVVSHAVWAPILIKSPQAVYKFAAIGSVVTHEQHRNQGLSSQIITECIESAKSEDCDFAILWTNLFDFYRKIGFELAGSELTAQIDQSLVDAPSGKYKIREGNNIDPKAISRVFQKHTVSSVRTENQVREYLKIPNQRVYTAWDHAGQLVAYMAEGKGADLQDYIHEWGGAMDALFELATYIHKTQKKTLQWMIPYHSMNLIRSLTERKINIHHGMLGMIKLLNAPRFAEKVQKYLQGALKRTDIEISSSENGIQFSSQHSKVKFTESEFVQYVFGPKVPFVATQMDSKDFDLVSSCLPLPLWIWGWDSI
tara:strand:+ start:42135 stop:43262 length:1128 start_codon:yes stop_codon:yes gene_type:complete